MRKYLGLLYLLVCLPPVGGAYADTPLTAGIAKEQMPTREFFAFVAGISHGLAFARYQTGGAAAMDCVFDWFYRGENSMRHIEQAFERFADHHPSAVMAVLVKRKCGD